MSIKVKVDERGRITIPNEIRESMGIDSDTELILEKRGASLVFSKQLTPEEFIEEARSFQEEIKSSRIEEVVEPLKIKKIWKEKPK